VAECEPNPKIVSSQVTSTFATIFWSALRSKFALVMDIVFARPSCRREQSIQTVGVRALIGIGDHLTTQWLAFGGVHHAPFDLREIEWHLQGCHRFFDPLRRSGRTPGSSILGGGPDVGTLSFCA